MTEKNIRNKTQKVKVKAMFKAVKEKIAFQEGCQGLAFWRPWTRYPEHLSCWKIVGAKEITINILLKVLLNTRKKKIALGERESIQGRGGREEKRKNQNSGKHRSWDSLGGKRQCQNHRALCIWPWQGMAGLWSCKH